MNRLNRIRSAISIIYFVLYLKGDDKGGEFYDILGLFSQILIKNINICYSCRYSLEALNLGACNAYP